MQRTKSVGSCSVPSRQDNYAAYQVGRIMQRTESAGSCSVPSRQDNYAAYQVGRIIMQRTKSAG